MKNVRLFYKKGGPLRFVSHLDMNRFMARILRLSGVPIWYTEGFNRHPYITFALPLSLGFFSEYEIMDFRIAQDDYSVSEAKKQIADVCPEGIEIIDLKEPVNKAGKIAFAEFEISVSPFGQIGEESLKEFLSRDEIIISKKSKKGVVNDINIAPKIKKYECHSKNDKFYINLYLPAGGSDNLNPKSVMDEYLKFFDIDNASYTVTRKKLFLANGEVFV